MKKILVFGFTDNIGGIETFYMTYYRKLKNRYHFDFITSTKNMAFEEELKRDNCEIFHVPNFKKNPIKYYKIIKKIMKGNNYDIVHVNMLSAANILPVKAANKLHIKSIIVHSHNNGIPKNSIKKIMHRINKKYLKNKKFIKLACSKEAGYFMFGENDNFLLLNNAIDINNFLFKEDDRNKIREEYGIEKNDYLIGHVGRFCEQKNQKYLVNLMKKIKYENIKLMMIGSGDDKNKLLDEIRKNKLEKRIIILDNKQDIYRYYSAFDLFVFPSIFEGLGIVAIEAQASGLSCIFSENIIEAVNINDNKYINLSNEKEWIKSIIEMKKNENRIIDRNKFSKRGYDINTECQKLKKIYEEGEISER